MKNVNHKQKTIHTSRTIMFTELSKVMNHGIESGCFNETLDSNVINKLSRRNLIITNYYLRQLYSFNEDDLMFRCFRHYWLLVSNEKKSILALLFALSYDFLLGESIDVVVNTKVGERVTIENLDENIESYHPGKYSEITRHSAAKRIASSWKQAGYIVGKFKNIRVKPTHDYYTVAFALLLSYLHGDRGEYILLSKWVKALAINIDELRDLAKEAAKRDLLQYQHGGNITVISFENQIKTLNNGE